MVIIIHYVILFILMTHTSTKTSRCLYRIPHDLPQKIPIPSSKNCSKYLAATAFPLGMPWMSEKVNLTKSQPLVSLNRLPVRSVLSIFSGIVPGCCAVKITVCMCFCCSVIRPVNKIHATNVAVLLGQSRRRWASSTATLG